MRLIFEPIWSNIAWNEFRPLPNSSHRAFGLYTSGGFCLIGGYRAASQYLFVVLNNAVGIDFDTG